MADLLSPKQIDWLNGWIKAMMRRHLVDRGYCVDELCNAVLIDPDLAAAIGADRFNLACEINRKLRPEPSNGTSN